MCIGLRLREGRGKLLEREEWKRGRKPECGGQEREQNRRKREGRRGREKGQQLRQSHQGHLCHSALGN